MQITIFSVWMTVLWSSILIILFYYLRKKSILLDMCSVSGVIILYVFCMVRMMIPIELPWTKVIFGGELYNKIFKLVRYEMNIVFKVHTYQVMLLIWVLGTIILLIKYIIQYLKIEKCLDKFPVVKDERCERILGSITKDKNKIPRIIKTSAIDAPCCMGVVHKKIIIPNKKYSDEEIYYILLHEYSHLQNNDLLTKILINIICAIYWWNPFVYLLKKDLDQSLEIRCDGNVISKLNNQSRSNYLSAILKEYNDDCKSCEQKEYNNLIMPLFEEHSEKIVERFELVASGKNQSMISGKVIAGIIAICLLLCSYLVIIQTKYDVPTDEIITSPQVKEVSSSNSYIIIHKDGTYSLCDSENTIKIEEESANMLIKDGFMVVKE